MIDSSLPILLVAAVEREAEGIRLLLDFQASDLHTVWPLTRGTLLGHPVALVITGVGMVRVATALAFTLSQNTFSKVLQFGVGGAYPNSGLNLGDVVLATSECDPQSGIETPHGFRDLTWLGFPIAERFPNRLPIENQWSKWIAQKLPETVCAEVATVVTCSGVNSSALHIEKLSGAKVEVMEGFPAAWISSCLNLPFAELRVISNTTGDRSQQRWDLEGACVKLTAVVQKLFS